jgi:curli biogenesis system outer membrane secretion channel CsgG
MWMGVGLAESLTTDLRKLGLFMVERQQVEKLMQERRLTEIFNEQQAVKIGKLVGASLLVIGAYQSTGTQLRVDARLVDVSTGQILQSYGVEGKKDELFDVERKLVAAMGERLKVDPAKLDKNEVPSLDAFKRYIQSSSKLLVKDGAAVVSVRSVAVGPIAGIAGAVKAAMEKQARVAIRAAVSEDAKAAGADALVLGSITRAGARVRVDLRAVLSSSGEVVASATSEGAQEEEARVIEQAAQMLVNQLGLGKNAAEKRASTPIYKQWWLWTIVGAVVVGGVTAGAVVGSQQQVIPSSNATIIAR